MSDSLKKKVIKHYINLWVDAYKRDSRLAKLFILKRNKDIGNFGLYTYNQNQILCNLYDPLHTGKIKNFPVPKIIREFPKCKISKTRGFYQGKPSLWLASIKMDDFFQYFAEATKEVPLILAMGDWRDSLEKLRVGDFRNPLERICLCSTLQCAFESVQLVPVQKEGEEALFAPIHVVGSSRAERGYILHEGRRADFLILPPQDNLEDKEILKECIRKVLRAAFLQKPKAKKIVIAEQYVKELANLSGQEILNCFKEIAGEEEFQFAPEIYLALDTHYRHLKGKVPDFLPYSEQMSRSLK